jgi:hypothetical protein
MNEDPLCPWTHVFIIIAGTKKGYQDYTNKNCKNTKQINHGKDMYIYKLRYHAGPVIYML